MLERFTQRARKVMGFAEQEAQLLGHMYIGTEHLLIGLLREDEGVAARALASLNVTLDGARKQVERIVGYGLSGTGMPKRLTPRSSRVLDRASKESSRLGHNYISIEHIFLGIAQADESVAVRVLSSLGVDRNHVREQIFRTLGYSPRTFESEATHSTSKTPRPSAARVTNETTDDGEPVRLFYSYSHRDAKLRAKLERCLSTLRRQGLISEWHDRKILPGYEWEGEIDQNLEAAKIILLLISPDFIDSDYCYEKELRACADRLATFRI